MSDQFPQQPDDRFRRPDGDGAPSEGARTDGDAASQPSADFGQQPSFGQSDAQGASATRPEQSQTGYSAGYSAPEQSASQASAPSYGQSQQYGQGSSAPAYGQPGSDSAYGQQSSYGQQTAGSAGSYDQSSAGYGQSAPSYGQYGGEQQYSQGQGQYEQGQQYGQDSYGQSGQYAQGGQYGQNPYGQSQQSYGTPSATGYEQPGAYAVGQQQYPQQGQQGEKKMRGITLWAIILSGLGLLLCWVPVLGFILAVVGCILGFMAVRKNPEAKPWPLIAGIVGAVAALIALGLGIYNLISIIAWMQYYGSL